MVNSGFVFYAVYTFLGIRRVKRSLGISCARFSVVVCQANYAGVFGDYLRDWIYPWVAIVVLHKILCADNNCSGSCGMDVGVTGFGTTRSAAMFLNSESSGGQRAVAGISLGIDALPIIGAVVPNLSSASRLVGTGDGLGNIGRIADDIPCRPSGTGPRYRSIYNDGTLVIDGQQPPRLPRTADPAAVGPHSRVRYDAVNGRNYQLREFDANGNLVRDIDLTNPTFSNGVPRPGHPGPPHQHRHILNDPNIGPQGGFRRLGPEPLEGGL